VRVFFSLWQRKVLGLIDLPRLSTKVAFFQLLNAYGDEVKADSCKSPTVVYDCHALSVDLRLPLDSWG